MLAETVPTTSSVAPADVSTETNIDAFVGEKLLVCGFGVLNNQREKSRTLKCTTLRVVPFIECFKAVAAASPAAQIFESTGEDEGDDDWDDEKELIEVFESDVDNNDDGDFEHDGDEDGEDEDDEDEDDLDEDDLDEDG